MLNNERPQAESKLDPSTATPEEIKAALMRVQRAVRIEKQRAFASRPSIPSESLLERLRRLSGADEYDDE